MEVKPGYTTTEFWLTLVALLGSAIALIHPGFDIRNATWVQPLSVAAGSIGTVAYTLSRSHVKAKVIAARAPVLAAREVARTTADPTAG